MSAPTPPASVTFETKCWEQDWEVLLKTERLEQMIARNKFPFAERVLITNSSHGMSRSNPAEFNAAVLAFIARH